MKLTKYIRDFIGRIQCSFELRNTYKRLGIKDWRYKKASKQIAQGYFNDCVLNNKGYFRLKFALRRYRNDKEMWDFPELDEVPGYILMTYGTELIMESAKVPEDEVLNEVLEENGLMVTSKDISRKKVTYFIQPETIYVTLDKK
ncbi:MAG: hypothetical protein IJS47_06525 [Clostridia bacterium]|nr:hypothetical protein [Clostridia bacterium]